MRILLIEDEPICAKTVVNALTSDGHFCDVVTSAQDYNNNMVSSHGDHYDLVILDIHLAGDIDGYDILLRLRSAKIKVPVLMLSCMSSVNCKAKGLGYGADDYLTKPFHKSELLARIKAIVRRTKGHPESVIKIGNININFDHRIVEVKGKTVHLTNKEYSMIELLALRKGTVLTKEMFLNHLYNGLDEPSDNKIVDVFMCKLRKKLESANDGKSHIETVWGRGYVLKEYIDDEEYSHADMCENTDDHHKERVKDIHDHHDHHNERVKDTHDHHDHHKERVKDTHDHHDHHTERVKNTHDHHAKRVESNNDHHTEQVKDDA